MALAADVQAARRLKGWGGPFLKDEKIARFLRVSASSVGVRQTAVDRRRMEECAQAALLAKHEVQQASRTLHKLAEGQPILARQAAVVGWATACVLWVYLGNPAHYHCAEAYRKAIGQGTRRRGVVWSQERAAPPRWQAGIDRGNAEIGPRPARAGRGRRVLRRAATLLADSREAFSPRRKASEEEAEETKARGLTWGSAPDPGIQGGMARCPKV